MILSWLRKSCEVMHNLDDLKFSFTEIKKKSCDTISNDKI